MQGPIAGMDRRYIHQVQEPFKYRHISRSKVREPLFHRYKWSRVFGY
jgi:hypothetical protein